MKGNFRLRWRCRYIHFASSHNQKKDNNKFKKKIKTELPENPTVWKSDNQGVKKETFIQMVGGARWAAGVERMHGKAVAGGQGRATQWLVDHMSHICVQINQEKQLWRERDKKTEGSNTGKQSLKTSGCKNLRGLPR